MIAVQTSREQAWLNDPRLLVPHGTQALDVALPALPGKRGDAEGQVKRVQPGDVFENESLKTL